MSKTKKDTKVIVKFPSSIEVSLVPANELKHYERFQWLVAFLAPIAVGFWTGYFVSNGSNKSLLFSATIFSLVALLFIALALRQRSKMFNGEIERKAGLQSFK